MTQTKFHILIQTAITFKELTFFFCHLMVLLMCTVIVLEDVLRHGNETEILVVKKMLSDRLEELYTAKIAHEPEENDVVYFRAQEESMMKAIQALGSVKVSSAYAALSCVVGGLKRVPHGKRSSFSVNTRLVSEKKLTE